MRLEVEFVGRGQIITMESSRTRQGSPGINGGGFGSRQKQLRRLRDGSLETIGGTDDETGEWLPQMLGGVLFKQGESFVFESGGCGGWGDPRTRDPRLVADDVKNDIVSAEVAREVYGVAVTDDCEVDAAATASLRG